MTTVEQQVRDWLERVVIGLNLCPFARKPYQAGLVRLVVTQAKTNQALLDDLRREVVLLEETESVVTTLIVVEAMLADFDEYNRFLDHVDDLLRLEGWAADYQIATFHPQYVFAGTNADDPGNLTNRAPWPILHILAEGSIDEALAENEDLDPEAIPRRNIRQMESLTPQQRQDYFPWLRPRAE